MQNDMVEEEEYFVKENTTAVTDNIEQLTTTRSVYIFDTIDNLIIANAISQINYLAKINSEDISIYINSNGGNVDDCFALIDIMDSCLCDIKTIVIGQAASAACLLSSNGTHGKRYAGQNSEFLYHEMSFEITDFKGSNIKYHKEMYDKSSKKFHDIFARNTGKNMKQIKKTFLKKGEDIWMDSQNAKKFGIIDEILSIKTRNNNAR
ncbi:MAG: ATP-dependent Clp protease proteolytic subunit [bacterium]|nr:ATP-dependent Clp protease proteolytic subunit [bacterium]